MSIRVPKVLSRNEFLSNKYNLPEIIRQHKISSTSEFFWATWKKKFLNFPNLPILFAWFGKLLNANIWTFETFYFARPLTVNCFFIHIRTLLTQLPHSHTYLFILFKNLSSFFAMASIAGAMSKSFAIVIAIVAMTKTC